MPPFGSTDGLIAALLACGVLALFMLTLCPTIYIEDAPEFSTAAAVVGIPHPPGYPLYTLLAALFVRAVPIGDMGYRSNLFSGVCGAAAVALLWVFLRRLSISRASALAASLCFALGATFWSQCTVAEVHAFNCLLLILSLLSALWATVAPSRRSFAWTGVVFGLLAGHRNLNVLFLAGPIVMLEQARQRVGGARRLWAWLAVGAALTAAVYLYLPIAAARNPAVDVGAPSTWRRFATVVTTRSYFRHLATAPLGVNCRRLLHFAAHLPADLGIAVLAVPAGFALRRRDEARPLVWSLVWIVASSTGFASLYNVLDVDVYFLPGILALAVLAAFGFDAGPVNRFRALLPFAALAVLPFNWSSTNLRHCDLARTYERDLLASAPPQAVVVSFGDTATHALWYGQAVEHFRSDVTVVSVDEIGDWYVELLSRRYPTLVWPTLSDQSAWLRDFILENASARPICLTEPLALGFPNLKPLPEGLLYCLRSGNDRQTLWPSVAFWTHARIPAAWQVAHADVHVQMLAFSYARSRFALAAALVAAGDPEGAKAQLAPIDAADPDTTERAISKSIESIGRFRARALLFGARASRARRLDPRDPAFADLLDF